MTDTKLTNAQFISRMASLLRPMMEGDLIRQDDLFKMQDEICALIAQGATDGAPSAKAFAKEWKDWFMTLS